MDCCAGSVLFLCPTQYTKLESVRETMDNAQTNASLDREPFWSLKRFQTPYYEFNRVLRTTLSSAVENVKSEITVCEISFQLEIGLSAVETSALYCFPPLFCRFTENFAWLNNVFQSDFIVTELCSKNVYTLVVCKISSNGRLGLLLRDVIFIIVVRQL